MEVRYYQELYFCEKLKNKDKAGIFAFIDMVLRRDPKDKEAEVIADFQTHNLPRDTYVITLSQSSRNHLDFFKATYLKQDYYADKDFFVVGFAQGHENATLLVQKIVDDTLEQTKGFDIRGFLSRYFV